MWYLFGRPTSTQEAVDVAIKFAKDGDRILTVGDGFVVLCTVWDFFTDVEIGLFVSKMCFC
jgi:hypothetical protein